MGATHDDGVTPLPLVPGLGALVRCIARSAAMIVRGDVRMPTARRGDVLTFADGTTGRVYRETVAPRARTDDPVLLVVRFRLRRATRPWAHAAFRLESILNTLLFVGFPGFVSKLWLAHDEHGFYRGVYQWDGEARAHAYVRALWWALVVVSERRSIGYVVVPGVVRDDLRAGAPVVDDAWWRITAWRYRGTCGTG
jgi:hypothetical protein